MDRVELHDVEYGDCTVLVGQNRQILMVDCGSVSRYARRGEEEIDRRFNEIFSRYAPAAQRQFLLTHYHRDHMSGFLKQVKKDPGYFDRVYLPALPCDKRGVNPVLEFAVFAHFFAVPQSDFAQVNTTCLRIFDALKDSVGADRIFTLGGGDIFTFDGAFYEVLSPARNEPFPFDAILTEAVENLNICLSSPFHTGRETEFLETKDAFVKLYMQCQTAFAPSDRATPGRRRPLRPHGGYAQQPRPFPRRAGYSGHFKSIRRAQRLHRNAERPLPRLSQPPKPRPVESRYSNDRRRVR